MSRKPQSEAENAESPGTGGHARRITVDELHEAVTGFYGMMTLVVDPSFAKSILEFNTANRRINRRKLVHLVTQFRAGEYENTGEPVIISAEGVLNDGQHRLHAVVESDVTVDMDVRFGIARKAVTKTDTGASRTGGDVLALRGITGSASVAPAVRILILMRRGLPESIREFVSNAEVDAAFDKWKSIETIGRQLAGYNFPKGVRSTPLLATAFLASRSPGKDKLTGWLETLATGLASGKSDPAYILRERLMRGVDAPIGTREGLLEKFALMIMSWNAYAAGEGMTAKDFRWSATGKNAKPFPKVDGARGSVTRSRELFASAGACSTDVRCRRWTTHKAGSASPPEGAPNLSPVRTLQ